MELINTILGLITAHIFGDYVFQSAYIAENKKRNIYHLLVHCWIYTACFWCVLFLLNKLNLWIIAFVFVSHVILDYIKSRIEEKIGSKAYALDQLLHYVVIGIVVLLVK